MIKLGTFFSGIGAVEKALKNIGIEYDLQFFSEIDKYAIKSYVAIHNETEEKNIGDISKLKGKDLPYCDMWFGGFPCQDISVAGKLAGWEENTRSSLGWEMIRLAREVKQKPKYILFENVKNITSKRFIKTLNLFKSDLEDLGYTLYDKVLNAKNYGIPQNRERYFLIASLGEQSYNFPEPIELKLKLKDMLEFEVDEKYYLSDKIITYLTGENQKDSKFPRGERFRQTLEKTNIEDVAVSVTTRAGGRMDDNFILDEKNAYTRTFGSRGKLQDKDCSDTITSSMGTGGGNVPLVKEYKSYVSWEDKKGRINTQDHRAFKGDMYSGAVPAMERGIPKVLVEDEENKIHIRENTKKGYKEATEGDGIYINRPHQKRGVVQKDMIPTLVANGNNLGVVVKNLRIRKLTPKECFRLMGFGDEDFDKAKEAGISDTQLYKQAGNSIVVNVLERILERLD